jgi:hypothetical protein
VAHRLYVDEVGNPGMSLKIGPNDRYLSLAGTIFDTDHMREFVAPSLEQLKREFFPGVGGADKPLVLHRKELVNKNWPFESLRDPATCARFDDQLVELLTRSEFVLIIVTIDKLAHRRKYTKPAHPYHYCMLAMLERYVGWLEDNDKTGDVLAEARGDKPDQELSAAFAEVVENGSFQSKDSMQRRLSSHLLSFATKDANEAGLQITDLVAHPCFRRALARQRGEEPPAGFARRITDAMVPKLRRSRTGRTRGLGIKWLP